MQPKNASITIAIVAYNSYDTINTCMSELIDSKAYPVFIIDNASTDGSAEKLKKRYPSIHLIESTHNLGYGRAANLALADAQTPYVFVVNPDLKLTVQAVAQLESVIHTLDPKPTVLAPATNIRDYRRQGVIECSRVVGAAMLFDVNLLKKVGFFDENIFLFSEETDICLRIKKSGQHVMLDTNTYIEHMSRQSTRPSRSINDLKNWHFGWSHLYFYNKHGLATGKKNPYRISALYLIKYIFSINPEKRAKYKARFLGAQAYLKGEPAILPDGSPQWPRTNR